MPTHLVTDAVDPKRGDRKVGFEIEFAGVPLDDVAQLIRSTYGGELKTVSAAEKRIENTRLGQFRVEIDAKLVKQFAQSTQELRGDIGGRRSSITAELVQSTIELAEGVASELSTIIVPTEIIAPPIAVDAIRELELLSSALSTKNATGTQSSLAHAFGLHINPEVQETNVESILAHIRAFALLQPLMLEIHGVDISRRLSTHINLYDTEYLVKILADDYRPSLSNLIRDYHAFNPTRSRALDMLPLFKHLRPDLINQLYGPDELINSRPTYHYRLPNSEIGNPSWSLLLEWHRWLIIEQFANNPKCLNEIRMAWLNKPSNWLDTYLSGDGDWLALLKNKLEKHHVSIP